jgi:hypothetical protein
MPLPLKTWFNVPPLEVGDEVDASVALVDSCSCLSLELRELDTKRC